jgi:hypothetical protein
MVLVSKKLEFMNIIVLYFYQCGISEKREQLFPQRRPFLMETAGMYVIAFGKTQKTFLIFIHALDCFNDLRKMNAVGIAGKDIAPFPSPDAFDKTGLGKGGEQLPQIFVGNTQGLDKMMCRKYLEIRVDHITQHPDGILGCFGQDH